MRHYYAFMDYISKGKIMNEFEKDYSLLRADNTRLAAEVERLKQELDEALLIHQTDTGTESVVATLQARIDELMLEYCPDEMTHEQLDEWARHQIPAPEARP